MKSENSTSSMPKSKGSRNERSNDDSKSLKESAPSKAEVQAIEKRMPSTDMRALSSMKVDKKSLAKSVELYLTRQVGDEEIEYLRSEFVNTNTLSAALTSHYLTGIPDQTETSLDDRRKKFGHNELKQPATRTFWELWTDAAKDKIMMILIVAAIISLFVALAFGQHKEVEWIEGFAILVSVFIVTTVTAGNDYAKEKQFRELQGSAIRYVTVIRAGKNLRIEATELLVGDVILLEMGEEMPCDVLMTYSFGSEGISMDESAMTGETEPCRKQSLEYCLDEVSKIGSITSIQEICSPILVSGTTVMEGSGYGIVIAVGSNSQIGMNCEKLAMDTETTPLQNKLGGLADQIGWAGGIAALLIVAALTIQFWILWALGDRTESAVWIFQQHLKFFTEAITIIVVAVPEGLPLAVTISLAYSVKRMLADQNYVRKLAACEIMGGATDICSDKTGTLTRNRMTVVAFWNSSNLEMEFSLPKDRDNIKLYGAPFSDALWQNISINSTASLLVDENNNVSHVGNASECALLEFSHHMGNVREDVRHAALGDSLDAIVKQIPFTSIRKSMTTVIRHPENPKLYRVLVKGASEVILSQCTERIDSKGASLPFTPAQKDRVGVTIIQLLASMALRTLCLGYHDFDPNEFEDWDVKDEKGVMKVERRLTCLGIFGIRDPVREEVPGAVQRMQQSGVTVRMVTGDNIDAAKSIAIHCNIYRPQEGGIAMLGPEFTQLVGGIVCKWCRTATCPCPVNKNDSRNDDASDDSDSDSGGCCRRSKKDPENGDSIPAPKNRVRIDVVGDLEEMKRLEPKLQVLARSQPQDKYTLVVGLRQLGKVVCVTGDGTNDAPALKRADVGMSMGLTGKDAAKEASDIVLLDDNFYGIVRACVWGRNIYENIARFLQFQLTVNVVAVLLSFLSAFFVRSAALTTVQLLWLNLIMDTLAALALATDQPSDELLDRPPVAREQGLVTKSMWRTIITNSIYQMTVACMILFSGECWIPETPWLTDTELSYIHNGGREGYCEPDFSVENDPCLEQYPAYPEYQQYHTGENGTCNWIGGNRTVIVGRAYHIFSEETDYPEVWLYDQRIGASRHYTVLFNAFVFMQIFNLLLSRKLGNDLHVFSGIWTNKIWIGVFGFATIFQIILCQYGGIVLSVHPEGLTWQQWLISVALGVGMLPWGLAIRLIPSARTDPFMPPEAGIKECDPLSNDRVNTVLRLSSNRLSSRMLIYPKDEKTSLRRNLSGNRD